MCSIAKHEDRQNFLAQEFDVTMMCPDIRDFHKPKVQNSVTGQLEYLPQVSIFGSVLSCIDLSKQNMKRKHNKANVANFSCTTGETLESSLIYIIKYRPRISFLESVPEMDNDFEQEDGSITSGSEVVVERLEAENFTVLILELNCSDYGSRANRVRWWAAIADCPPGR